jgi:hypothetical protein
MVSAVQEGPRTTAIGEKPTSTSRQSALNRSKMTRNRLDEAKGRFSEITQQANILASTTSTTDGGGNPDGLPARPISPGRRKSGAATRKSWKCSDCKGKRAAKRLDHITASVAGERQRLFHFARKRAELCDIRMHVQVGVEHTGRPTRERRGYELLRTKPCQLA